jgi:hypothetical protein
MKIQSKINEKLTSLLENKTRTSKFQENNFINISYIINLFELKKRSIIEIENNFIN